MFATLLLPNFYLQAIARHQPALRLAPLAVLDDQAQKAIILQLNEAAESAGVQAGMAPSQGLARCLQLVIKARARDREQQITDILLHHGFLLSPLVEATAPGVCTVEFRQKSGESLERVMRVIDSLTACDLQARAGLAENPDASFLAAHLAKPVLQIPAAKEFLASLPLATLMLGHALPEFASRS